MPVTVSVHYKNQLLDALVRGTASGLGLDSGFFRIRLFSAGYAAQLSNTSVLASSWTAPVNGVSTLASALVVTATGSGTPAICQLFHNSNAQVLYEGTVGTSGSGADFILSSVASISTGNTVNLTNASIKNIANVSGQTLRVNEAIRTALTKSIITGNTVDFPTIGADAGARLAIYNGTQPASADTPLSGQTKLAEYTMSSGSYSAAASGSISLAATKTVAALATGTATWARWTKGLFAIDGSVGTTGTDFLLDTTSLVSGANVILTNADLKY